MLPITDKLDIKRHPDRYLSRAMPPGARLETYTGGSTRHPMRFFLQKHVTRPKEQAFMQDLRARPGRGRGRPGPRCEVAVPTAGKPTAALDASSPSAPVIGSCANLERRFIAALAEALGEPSE